MVSFVEIAEVIQCLLPCKWHSDINHFAESIGATTDEANDFISRIEKGGGGLKSDGSWEPNPLPFDKTIDLTSA